MRVIVADESAALAQELGTLLSTEFLVVGTALTGRKALECIWHLGPDVVVLSLNLPELNGFEVTRILMKEQRHPEIVICAFESSPESMEAAYESGALGYVLKMRAAVDLVPAIKAAGSRRRFQSPLANGK